MVAAVATALGILALANLTSAPPRAGLAQEAQIRVPTAASIAYSRDSPPSSRAPIWTADLLADRRWDQMRPGGVVTLIFFGRRRVIARAAEFA